MTPLLAYIAIPLITIVLIPFLNVKQKGFITLSAIVLNAILSGYAAIEAIFTQPTEIILAGNYITGEIPIRIDGLSGWFMLTINLVFVMGVIYGISYMKAYREQTNNLTLHAIAVILLHTSLISLCTIQNSLVFLVVWEIMALSAFIAVIFEHEKIATIKAGINYLIQSHLSIVFLMTGFLWIAAQTGSYDFRAIATYTSSQHPLYGLILFSIFFIGIAFKAGFIPFHTWLPHAHPAAPAHISGIMSGVLIKIAIYAFIRFIFYIKTDYTIMGEIVILISVATGFYGILNAAVHRDFKRMLAYCTIENIGIIGIGIGIGLLGLGNNNALLYYLGFGGALLHTFNHAIVKALLFFTSGSIYQQTHTRNMNHLGGLMKQMPNTGFMFLIGALAIGGIPPFNAFVSEYLIYTGLIEGLNAGSITQMCVLILSIGGLSIIGGLSVLTFTKSFGIIFLGTQRTELHHTPREVSRWMQLPQFVLGIAMLSVMIFPTFYINTAQSILVELVPQGKTMPIGAMVNNNTTLWSISLCSFAFMLITFIIWRIRRTVTEAQSTAIQPTWTCAYTAPYNKMQYTGKSYSKPLSKTFNFLLNEEKHYTEIEDAELLPQKLRRYSSHYHDLAETYIIIPFNKRLIYMANYFKFIQNGKAQWYVLYGIVFVSLIVIIGFIDNIWQIVKEIILNN